MAGMAVQVEARTTPGLEAQLPQAKALTEETERLLTTLPLAVVEREPLAQTPHQ